MRDLKPTQDADAQFVALASQLLNDLTRFHSPEEVYVIHIDHWFDHKWQYFSGKTIGAVGLWRWTVPVPPFDPGVVWLLRYFWRRQKLSFLLALLLVTLPFWQARFTGTSSLPFIVIMVHSTVMFYGVCYFVMKRLAVASKAPRQTRRATTAGPHR